MKENWTLVDAVLEHAEKQPDKVALIHKKQTITYGQLACYMKKGAAALKREYNIKAKDRVMLTGLSKPEYVVLLLAVQYLGAVSVPTDKSAVSESLSNLYKYVEPALFLTDSKINDEEVRTTSLRDFYNQMLQGQDDPDISYVHPEGSDIAEIIFTTGTTGRPKGAMLSYNAVRQSGINTIVGTKRRSEDIELLPLPLNHSFGMRVLRAMIFLGGTIVLQNGFLFIKETRQNIENNACTGISIVAASIEMLYRSLGNTFREVFSQLKRVEVGASSLSVAMKEKLLEILPQVELYNVWGSSETGGAIFLDVPNSPGHLGSLGILAEGVGIKIIGPDGEEVKGDSPETAGRMILSGDMKMSGYYGQEDVTKETLIGDYLYTNDIVYRTEEGYVYMMGRADDIINVGGEKVSPIEVENIAGLHPEVRECACISGEDREGIFEKVPVLFVVSEKGSFDEKDMRQFLSSRMEQFKIPKYFVEIDELPRNRMLKIDRKALKEKWEKGEDESSNSAVITTIFNRRSIRDFEEKPVPRHILESLVECGIMAPSGHNRQSWKFTVVEKQDTIKQMKEIILKAAEKNKARVYGFNNPGAIIIISNDVRNDDGVQDSSCAAQNIMLAAHSYGLGSTWNNALMKLCDEPEVRRMLDDFKIPKTHNVWAMIFLGYPANMPKAPVRKKESVIHFVDD